MKIENEALPYILFQRTQYLKKTITHKAVAKFLRVSKGVDSLESMLKANVLLSSKSVKAEYKSDMLAEYESFKEALPSFAENILDIGCGIAGLDVFISAHYNNQINVHLLDKSSIDVDVHYGFEKQGSFYNSLSLSKKVLTDNGVGQERIFTQEVTAENSIDFDTKFDLIISIISWGFHYPVEVYLNQVYDTLNKGGVLILDVRKESGGIELLTEKFGKCTIVKEFRKHNRVKLVK